MDKLTRSVTSAINGAGLAVKEGLLTIKQHPMLLIYPYLAALFIIVTFPLVNALVITVWGSLANESLFSLTDGVSNKIRILLGLVTFSFFYSTFVTAYFTCAISASVLANLDGRPVSWLYGLRMVARHLPRVSKFALLAILFFPISVIAQRHKLKQPRGVVSVIGSSLSLNMSQLAPVILTEQKSLASSIRSSADTLGSAWRQNLVIKISTYAVIFLLVVAGLLPKLLKDSPLNDDATRIITILTGVLLSLIGYVVTKVIGSVFTATLYHQAQSKTKAGRGERTALRPASQRARG